MTPITPSSDEILGLKCVESIDELQGDGRGLSLSVVTPPKATKGILEQAAKQGTLEGIWLQVSVLLRKSCKIVGVHADLTASQPGAEDNAVLDLIDSNDWLKGRTVHSGPCVLVLGDKLRRDAAEKL